MVTVAKIPYDTKMCLLNLQKKKRKFGKKRISKLEKMSVLRRTPQKVALNEVIISNNNKQRTNKQLKHGLKYFFSHAVISISINFEKYRQDFFYENGKNSTVFFQTYSRSFFSHTHTRI